MKNTTLCYIENEGNVLLLHRVKKKNDINHDKWIGIGGHFEAGESPFDCAVREIFEESALRIAPEALAYRGIVTFVSPGCEDEQMHLFTADITGSGLCAAERPIDCAEGDLEWVPKERVGALPTWEGDRIFLALLDAGCPFFSLRLVYDAAGRLLEHTLRVAGKEALLISACLLGVACRYDGASKPLHDAALEALGRRYVLIPVCPEQLGGLATPRPPCEIRAGRVVRQDGADLSDAYQAGARETLRLTRLLGVRQALLKAKSPSCGSGSVYDGSFSGRRVLGDGVTAALLRQNGITVRNEEEIDLL